MPDDNQQALREAIDRNTGVVLSLPSAGMLRHCKSRFLACAGDEIVVEAIPGEQALIGELISTGRPVGVSFRSNDRTVIFASSICRYEKQFQVNPQLVVDAVILSTPRQFKSMQRRADYRVSVPADSEMFVRLWRIPEQAILEDKPQSSQSIPAKIWDLSIGGMGVVLLPAQDEERRPLLQAQRLRIELTQPEQTLLLEGRIAHLPVEGSSANRRAGIIFKKMENDVQGRQQQATLARLVAELQRIEVRRYRRQITKVA
jgi:c-di-GMP-binding flagellar brake protein YcgR